MNSKGVALVTYKAKGIQRHVIYWGAEGDTPEFFRYDRSGGAVSKKIKNWQTLKNVCGPYTGPPLRGRRRRLHDARTARTGRSRTGSGSRRTTAARPATEELHVSHWRGAAPVLTVKSDWSYPQHFNHIYGTYTYHGRPCSPASTPLRQGAGRQGP